MEARRLGASASRVIEPRRTTFTIDLRRCIGRKCELATTSAGGEVHSQTAGGALDGGRRIIDRGEGVSGMASSPAVRRKVRVGESLATRRWESAVTRDEKPARGVCAEPSRGTEDARRMTGVCGVEVRPAMETLRWMEAPAPTSVSTIGSASSSSGSSRLRCGGEENTEVRGYNMILASTPTGEKSGPPSIDSTFAEGGRGELDLPAKASSEPFEGDGSIRVRSSIGNENLRMTFVLGVKSEELSVEAGGGLASEGRLAFLCMRSKSCPSRMTTRSARSALSRSLATGCGSD
jgi:hypothetical protein